MKAISIATAALLAVSSVMAEEPTYARVSGWTIGIDTSLSNGCFMYTGYEGGALLRIGFRPDESDIYLLLGDADWESIEYGKTYSIQLTFGDESPWTGDAEGFSFDPPDDQGWLHIVIPGDKAADFVSELMREHTFTVHYNDQQIAHLGLRGSYRAATKMMECQTEMTAQASDPFAEPKTASDKDPFL